MSSALRERFVSELQQKDSAPVVESGSPDFLNAGGKPDLYQIRRQTKIEESVYNMGDHALQKEWQDATGRTMPLRGWDNSDIASMNDHLVQKYNITYDDYIQNTQNFLERGANNVLNMFIGGAEKVPTGTAKLGMKAGAYVGPRVASAVSRIGGGEALTPEQVQARFAQKYPGISSDIQDIQVSSEVLNVLEGTSDVALSFFAPVATTALGTIAETDTYLGDTVNWSMEKLTDLGTFINQAPLLKQFRDGLSEEEQQRFDTFVGGGAFSYVMTSKLRNPKTGKIDFATIRSNVKPSQIISNFSDAFFDISQGEVPKGTVADVLTAPVRKTADFLTKPVRNVVSNVATKVGDTAVDYLAKTQGIDLSSFKQTEPAKKFDLPELPPDTTRTDLPQVDVSTKTFQPGERFTFKEKYNPDSPSHRFLQHTKNSLTAKVLDDVKDGDTVILKDGVSGIVTKTDDGFNLTFPRSYTKKSVSWESRPITKADIESVFDVEVSPKKFLDDAGDFSTDTKIESFDDIISEIKPQKLEEVDLPQQSKLVSLSKDDVSPIIERIRALTKQDTKGAKAEIRMLRDKVHSIYSAKSFIENLSVKDVTDMIRSGRFSLAEGLKISAKNLVDDLKTAFSSDTILSTSEQLKKVHADLGSRLERATYKKGIKVNERLSAFDVAFEKANEIKKLSKSEQKKRKVAYLNGDVKMTVKQRSAFDASHADQVNAGFDVKYRKDYIPRVVKDSVSLMNYFRDNTTKFQEYWDIIKIHEDKIGRALDDAEKAQLVNEYLSGELQNISDKTAGFGSQRQRKIKEVIAEIADFYYDPMDGVSRYFDQTYEAISLVETLGGEKSIVNFVDEQIINGTLTPKEGKRVESILLSRFTDPTVSKFVSTYKNVSHWMNVTKFSSALTQLEDLGVSFYSNGVLNTLKSLGRHLAFKIAPEKLSELIKQELQLEDLGLEFLNMDMRDDGGAFRKATDKLFKYSGFGFMDRLGKEVYVNSALEKWKKFAESGPSFFDTLEGRDLNKVLSDEFGLSKMEITQFKDDLKAGEITDNVKYVLFSDISKVQPITKSAVPVNYNKAGNAKVFYMYKLFLSKRLEFYYKEFFKGSLNSPKEFAQKSARIVRYSAMMMLAGMAVDEIKDMLLGRYEGSSINDRVIDNAIKLLSVVNKYTWYQFKEETLLGDLLRYNERKRQYEARGKEFTKEFESEKGVVWGTLKGLWSIGGFPMTPLTAPIDEIMNYRSATASGGTYSFRNDSYTVSRIPLAGKPYYRWFGAGHDKIEKKANERKQTPGIMNRTFAELLSPSISSDGAMIIPSKIINVIDGDTVIIGIDKSMIKKYKIPDDALHKVDSDEYDYGVEVRFIGSDTAETVHPSMPVQFYGKEASDYARQELQGKYVTIKGDALGDTWDKYDRLLGYVETYPQFLERAYNIPFINKVVPKETFNEILVEKGYAKVVGSFDFTDKEKYYILQDLAQSAGIGVWNQALMEKYNKEHGITPEEEQKIFKYVPNKIKKLRKKPVELKSELGVVFEENIRKLKEESTE